MNAGRNDPCPCGSGKKYKKCCLAKDLEASSRQTAVIPPSSVAPLRPDSSHTQPHPNSAGTTAPARPAYVPIPPPPRDPAAERAEARWQEFESRDGEARIAVFLETLDDAELMTDDMAFEMLNILHADAVASGARTRFAEWVGALHERLPEVYDKGAHYYLSWCLVDALAEGRQEVVPSLSRELAARAGRDIDTFNRTREALAYHGLLDVLVEALRIAWPFVKSSDNIVPWGISEFAEDGVSHEIFDYLEHTASPDPSDAVLLDRVRFFVEDPREEYLREFIGDLTGKSGQAWRADDFALRPPRKMSRGDWGEDRDDRRTPDPGAIHLSRLISEFVGYLRHEEGVPFPRGELVRPELYRYFLRRNEGDLDPRPSMLEQAFQPNLKLPKPPRPAHPLCPERVTLDVHLAGMMGMLNGRYYSAAALFLAMPAWLRFLESRGLIDAATSRKVTAELLPLHASLLRIWEKYTNDPLLYRQGQAWPALP
ncbi:MAG: YecA family protein [Isosphaeraceae bacterium]